MTRVLVVRGQLANPWELRPWEDLPGRFEVAFLASQANRFDTTSLSLTAVPAASATERIPIAPLREAVVALAGDRYTAGSDEAFAAADIVHTEELSFWFSADAARRRLEGAAFKLVVTAWETIPFGRTYRNRAARRARDLVLQGADLFLAATERARQALLLEGVDEARVIVCPPGIDLNRFSPRENDGSRPGPHVILSPGRLVWEKGHQDAIRAMAVLSRQALRSGPPGNPMPLLRIVGGGPERPRLEQLASELGVSGAVEFDSLPYDGMPAAFASASALLLASLPMASGGLYPTDVPRIFWEEQFGMVLAEAMASGLDIVATRTGAIPEVLEGHGTLVDPGDYVQMARVLSEGPLSRPPGQRVAYPAEMVANYSAGAAASRLAGAYDRVLAA